MDVIAIATYLFYSLGNGRIPFYSDIVHSLSLLKDIGVEGGFYAYAVATVTLQIVLLFSLFFSAQCFLRQKLFSFSFLAIQEFMRFATVSCSISVIPLLLNYFLFTGSGLKYFVVYLLRGHKSDNDYLV